jgi:hypothetical protein
MFYKTYLAIAAGIAALVAAGLHGSVDSGSLLYLAVALLAFAGAAGAYDHHTRRDIEDRESDARLAARRAEDRAKP